MPRMIIRVVRWRGVAEIPASALRMRGKASPTIGIAGRSKSLGVTGEFISILGVGGMSFTIGSFLVVAGIGGIRGRVGGSSVGMTVAVGTINVGLAWGS